MKDNRDHKKVSDKNRSLYARVIESSRTSVDDNNWLVTMTDVMSLLLVFFIVFFVMSTSHKSKASVDVVSVKETVEKTTDGVTEQVSKVSSNVMPVTPSKHVDNMSEAVKGQIMEAKPDLIFGDKNKGIVAIASSIEQIKNEIDAFVKDMKMDNDVKAKVVNRTIVITMKENVTFDSGKSELIDGSKAVLDRIAKIIKERSGFSVEIEGHTDNVPISTNRYPSNLELSIDRAANVFKYFTDIHNIDDKRVFIKGSADKYPVASNDTAERRALNRRVDIKLKGNELETTS
ncbi:OmpA/MotB domain-containing protein [Candidatus Magnetoovum chiemensis]|nr:OmpA/MotB domain-containing protein [Candidatus Magnetoovum chiemensis]